MKRLTRTKGVSRAVVTKGKPKPRKGRAAPEPEPEEEEDEVWDEEKELERARSYIGYSRGAEAKAIRKERMLKAMRENMGVLLYAAKQAGITRRTHYNWLEADPQYRKDVDDIIEGTFDVVERKAFEGIVKHSNTALTIFFLKTRMKHRGYQERHEFSGPNGGPMAATLELKHEVPPDAIADILFKMTGGTDKAAVALAKLTKPKKDA